MDYSQIHSVGAKFVLILAIFPCKTPKMTIILDGRFGNFRTFLENKECGSPQEMISAFLNGLSGEADYRQTIYNFKEKLHPYQKNWNNIKSIYDFHLFLDENKNPIIENAKFKISENTVCKPAAIKFTSPVYRV